MRTFLLERKASSLIAPPDDVHWTAMGTHPVAGVYIYISKADFLKHTFERLDRLLKGGSVVMKVDHIYVSGDTAIVEMTSTSFALNGWPYAQRYCWITRFVDGLIVEVRAYLDSVLSIHMPGIECYRQQQHQQ